MRLIIVNSVTTNLNRRPTMEIKRLVHSVGLLACLSILPAPALPEDLGHKLKYILIWEDPKLVPINKLGEGTSAFTLHKCEHRNCYTTADKKLLNSTSDFDAIVFNGERISPDLPTERSKKQKYIYLNIESSHYYPICNDSHNDFFNWTWTYKLNSDAFWGYLRVYDLNGTVVGPNVDMHWSELGEVDNKTKMALGRKKVAGAWFVSNCNGPSRRAEFIKYTQKELSRHGLSIHIYGLCGKYKCPRSQSEKCNKMIADHYFFYMAFENSFAEDYVTEKVLTGLKNYAVPVVFGEADYNRFLPPGSYLDARRLGPAALATRMAAIIDSYQKGRPELYHDFFRWRSRYIIDAMESKELVCKACSDLNNAQLRTTATVYPNISQWWNSEYATCGSERVKSVAAMILALRVIARIWCQELIRVYSSA